MHLFLPLHQMFPPRQMMHAGEVSLSTIILYSRVSLMSEHVQGQEYRNMCCLAVGCPQTPADACDPSAGDVGWTYGTACRATTTETSGCASRAAAFCRTARCQALHHLQPTRLAWMCKCLSLSMNCTRQKNATLHYLLLQAEPQK